MHVTPQWQDASGGFRAVDIALADHPMHTGGAGRGIEIRFRRTNTQPGADEQGEALLVGPRPQRLILADFAQRLWLKSATTQVNVAITLADPQSAGEGVTDALALADGGITYRRLGDHFANLLHIKDFGAIGDGVVDDTEAFELAAESGQVVALNIGTYRIRRRIDFTRGGLIGSRDAIVYADPTAFTNTSANITLRYGTNAIVLAAQSLTEPDYTPLEYVTFRGFTIDMQDFSDGSRYVTAVVARNVKYIDISDLEIRNFSSAGGIKVATIYNGVIEHNYIHDFFGSNEYSGIEIDNDEINHIPSNGLRVCNNRIEQLDYTEAAFLRDGFEPNGIKIVGQNTSNLVVSGNVISYAGQGIDTYSQYSLFSDNRISNCVIFGIALKHGASYNEVSNNIITDSGVGSMVLVGDAAPHQTHFNNVHDNIMITVGASWVDFIDYAAATTADFGCIETWPDHTTTDNVIAGNVLVPGTLVTRSFAIIRKGFSDQTNHWVSNYAIAGTLGVTYKPNGELGVNTTISTAAVAFQNDAPGVESVALTTINRSSVVGTATVINMNATSNPDDAVRAVQLAAVNNSGSNNVDFEIRTPGGAPAAARVRIKGDGKVMLLALPTSSAGLSTGTLWNNAGVVNVA